MIKSELFMGRSWSRTLSDGIIDVQESGGLSSDELARFLSDVVTPRFPDYTVLSGEGYWKGESEDVIVLVILHDKHTPGDEYCDDETKIERIINEYKDRFHQESVLWVQTNVEIK